MTKAEATVEGQTIEIDTEGMEKRIIDTMDQKLREGFEKYLKETKESRPTDKQGKGVVEAFMPSDKKAKLIEEFQKGEKIDPRTIQEQWTIAIPYYTQYETAAHMRDFVFVTDVIKGKPGDVVNIPYVKDLEFAHVATPGITALSATTGLVSVLTTTLHESGAYYDAYYTDLEKIDSNLLDELNRVMAHAAIRAEDYDLMGILGHAGGATTEDFSVNHASGNTWINCGDYNVAGSTFEIRWIADAIGKLILKGKDVHPGELLLVLNPAAYATLLKKLATTTSTLIGYARPDIITKGLIEELFGVKIVVMGSVLRATFANGIASDATSYQVNYLMRPKRALALAPKRDILIETDKIVASRALRIVATHTYGVAEMDLSECVPIWSGVV